ncbi:LacI family DNA-binding transcriptional regulator [Spirochaeta dissipatitropha]
MSQQEKSGKADRDSVARLAGVSTATVSRVFNSPETVSDGKREQVLKAASELGYAPNKFASALARKSTGRILWIDGRKLSSHDPSHAVFYAGLYTESLEAVLNTIERSPYHLTIGTEHGHSLQNGDFDGIIVYDIDSQEQLQRLQASGIPMVFGHHVHHFTSGMRFAVDNQAAGSLIAELFQKAGHSKTAFVSGQTREISSHMDRKNGFCSAFNDLEVLEIEVAIGPAGGRAAAEQLIPEIRKGAVTAIAAVNDLTAFGLVQKLMDAGISIPGDVSIAACDNLPILDLLPLRITSLDLCLADIYRLAAEQLMLGLSQRNPPAEKLRIFPPKLVPGDSVSEPR